MTVDLLVFDNGTPTSDLVFGTLIIGTLIMAVFFSKQRGDRQRLLNAKRRTNSVEALVDLHNARALDACAELFAGFDERRSPKQRVSRTPSLPVLTELDGEDAVVTPRTSEISACGTEQEECEDEDMDLHEVLEPCDEDIAPPLSAVPCTSMARSVSSPEAFSRSRPLAGGCSSDFINNQPSTKATDWRTVGGMCGDRGVRSPLQPVAPPSTRTNSAPSPAQSVSAPSPWLIASMLVEAEAEAESESEPACELDDSDCGSDDEPATGSHSGDTIEVGEDDDSEDDEGEEAGESVSEVAQRDHPYPVSWLLAEKHASLGCGTLSKSVSCPDTVLHGKHACMASCKPQKHKSQ